jgi:hypothetical protein
VLKADRVLQRGNWLKPTYKYLLDFPVVNTQHVKCQRALVAACRARGGCLAIPAGRVLPALHSAPRPVAEACTTGGQGGPRESGGCAPVCYLWFLATRRHATTAAAMRGTARAHTLARRIALPARPVRQARVARFEARGSLQHGSDLGRSGVERALVALPARKLQKKCEWKAGHPEPGGYGRARCSFLRQS